MALFFLFTVPPFTAAPGLVIIILPSHLCHLGLLLLLLQIDLALAVIAKP